jgi:hypothetical protein
MESFNVVGSVQSVARNLKDFSPDAFAYLVIDEAHHAAARTYRRILSYFRPRFVLGLTATPERSSGESVLELFRECAHRLSLKEAVELGELVPIRCFRVKTNIDLSRVRYNQIQYNRRDIEDRVMIPGRDRLVLDTYRKYIPGRRAVVFCVNVRHGENVARLFQQAGIPAHAVSGRMPRKDREDVLLRYREGTLKVLCACDILNEGWDCPEVEALMMARPTLSKVLYLQQLGRGTRKSPGKESLIVFDFVDNASRYNQSLSLHRVLGQRRYRPGGLALAPSELAAREEEAIQEGIAPATVIDVGVWVKHFEEIDIFNWQAVVANMLSVSELERKLAASEGLVRRAIERGHIAPDHQVQVGERICHYFSKDRVHEIRRVLGLPKVTASTIKDLFCGFVREMDMSASYKPVMLLALLESVDNTGQAAMTSLVQRFRAFYETRRDNGLIAESPRTRMRRVHELSDADVARVIVEMPFEKFERRGYLKYDRDLAYIRFDSVLWAQLNPEDLEELHSICMREIEQYYGRLEAT